MIDKGDGGSYCGPNCVVKTTITIQKFTNNPKPKNNNNNNVIAVPVPQPPGSPLVPTLTETKIVKRTTTTTITNPVEDRIILYQNEDNRLSINPNPGINLGDLPYIGPFDPVLDNPNTGERKDNVTLQLSPLSGPSRTVTTQTQTSITVTTYNQDGGVLSSVPTKYANSETHVEVFWGGGWVPEEVILHMLQEFKTP